MLTPDHLTKLNIIFRPQPNYYNQFASSFPTYSALPQTPSQAPVLPAVSSPAGNVYNVPIKGLYKDISYEFRKKIVIYPIISLGSSLLDFNPRKKCNINCILL